MTRFGLDIITSPQKHLTRTNGSVRNRKIHKNWENKPIFTFLGGSSAIFVFLKPARDFTRTRSHIRETGRVVTKQERVWCNRWHGSGLFWMNSNQSCGLVNATGNIQEGNFRRTQPTNLRCRAVCNIVIYLTAMICYRLHHYNDVIMCAMASQITSFTIIYSTVYAGADKKNIKAPRHWPLCEEFTGDRWIPRTKGQWHRKCFHLMTSSWFGLFLVLIFVVVKEGSTLINNYKISLIRMMYTQCEVSGLYIVYMNYTHGLVLLGFVWVLSIFDWFHNIWLPTFCRLHVSILLSIPWLCNV